MGFISMILLNIDILGSLFSLLLVVLSLFYSLTTFNVRSWANLALMKKMEGPIDFYLMALSH